MIVNLHFGYKSRHHIYFDTEFKRGTIKLWSSYKSLIKENDNFLSEFIAQQESQTGGIFDANQYTEFLIGDEQDIFLILTSLMAIIDGNRFSFTSKEGRKITFTLEKNAKKKDIVAVNIQYGKIGKLTMGEAHKLQTIMRDILFNMGYSEQKILEDLKTTVQAIPSRP